MVPDSDWVGMGLAGGAFTSREQTFNTSRTLMGAVVADLTTSSLST